MNLILVQKEQVTDGRSIFLNERQEEHLRSVLRSQVGDHLKVGVVNGPLGEAVIESISSPTRVSFVRYLPAPAPAGFDVVMALPRPKVLKRIVENLTSIGVKSITFMNSARVEKYYWDSDLLLTESWMPSVLKGLEQAKDTALPNIEFKRFFRPFVEDELRIKETGSIVYAHPYESDTVKSQKAHPERLKSCRTVLIGPEGGWVDFELELFNSCGFTGTSFSDRPLKTEAFVGFLAGVMSARR